MPLSRVELIKLVDGVVLSGADGDNVLETAPVDLRRRIRIESVWAKGDDLDASQPNFTLEWAGGIQSTAAGDSTDAFQPYDDNEPLITSVGTETWQVVPMPDPRAPHIKFRLTSQSGSPVTSTYWLYLLLRDHFGD